MKRLAVVYFAITSLASCAKENARVTRPALGGEIVARVGDVGIGRTEIREHALERGITARAALTELEDQALLVEEARSRGMRVDGERLRERALVQLLLRRIEAENGPEAGTELESDVVIGARHQALVDTLQSARERVRIDYREPVVATLFARSELFEAIR